MKTIVSGFSAALCMMFALPARSAPTTVLAGGPHGVYRSTDGGMTWTTLLSNAYVNALAIDPLNASVMYAGAYNAVYKTTDGGAHWTEQTNGLTAASGVTAIQIDPTNTNIVYAATGNFGTGVYKSTDAGVHWTAINNGLTSNCGGCLDVHGMALDPLNPNTLYVTGDTGFQSAKTTNGGASWTAVNAVAFGFVVAVNPVQDADVFMAGPFGLSKSSNAGATWQATNLNSWVQSLVINPNTPSTMYAGGGGCTVATPKQCSSNIYQSTDTGATWNLIGSLEPLTGNEHVSALAIDPANPNTLYAGGAGGVWQSLNGGSSWNLIHPSTDGITVVTMEPNASQNAEFNVLETVTQDVIAVATDFKSFPALACGFLKGDLSQIAGQVQAGRISSGQGQVLTLQIQSAEASIPCP